MGTSTQTTNSSQNSNSNYNGTSSTAPGWAPQLAALTTAFNQAGGALTNAQGVQATPGTNTNYDTSGLNTNGATLNTSGTNAATGALSNLTNFNAGAGNNTSGVIDAAKQYADGQDIASQTKAATNGAMEQARDVTLPGIDQAAGATGNANSSRAGIAQGLVQRSLAENYQNTYNDLYSKAYSNGLGLAENQAQSNNTDNLAAYTSGASTGTNAATAGANGQTAALTNAGTQNTNNETNYLGSVSNAYAPLQAYMNLIGSQNWGSTTSTNGSSQTQGTGTSTTESTPSAFSTIAGLLGGGLSAASGLGWKPFG